MAPPTSTLVCVRALVVALDCVYPVCAVLTTALHMCVCVCVCDVITFIHSLRYTPQIDAWGVGCIIAELLLPEALFKPPRDTAGADMDVMDTIYNLCGTPLTEPQCRNEKNYWFGLEKKSRGPNAWSTATPKPRQRQLHQTLKERIESHCKGKYRDHHHLQDLRQCLPALLDLIDGLLTLNPEKRLTPKEAALKDFFWLRQPRRCTADELKKILPLNATHDSASRR